MSSRHEKLVKSARMKGLCSATSFSGLRPPVAPPLEDKFRRQSRMSSRTVFVRPTANNATTKTAAGAATTLNKIRLKGMRKPLVMNGNRELGPQAEAAFCGQGSVNAPERLPRQSGPDAVGAQVQHPVGACGGGL